MFFGDGTSNDYIHFVVQTDGTIRIALADNNAQKWAKTTTSAPFTNNSWTHIAFTQDGTSPVIYVNGIAVAQSFTVSTDKTLWFNNIVLNNGRIGTRKFSASEDLFFNGSIDEVRIFDRALSANEVSQLYMSNLYKLNNTDWLLYVNQTKHNSTTGLGNGAYTYLATAVDTAGNENSTETRTITLDTTFPTITINIPTNNTFTNDTSQDVNFTVSDTNINACWYSNDTYTANTTLTNCNTNITTVTWAEGQHNVTVYVNDSANNVNSSRVTFTIDTTFPTISYINPTPADKTFSTSTSAYINATITDASESSAWFDWNKSVKGYWAMDFRNSTAIFDNSTYNNFGTISGAVANSSGKRGDAFTFDGVNDRIQISDHTSLKPSANITFGAWINSFNVAKDVVRIIDKENSAGTQGYTIAQGATDGTVTARIGGTILANVGTISNNKWHLVMARYNGTDVGVFIDGLSVGSTPKTGSINYGTEKLLIGSRPALDFFFNGSIDEVLIFDRALSANEIKALYNTSEINNALQNNFTSLSTGTYNYSAYAIDSAGNLNWTSPDRQYTVDTTFPTIVFANPTTNSSNLSQNFIQANLSFSDTNLGTANISLFNSTQNIINSTAGTTSTLFINFTGLADGRYYLNATVNDSANNKNYTETRVITLDTTFPTITINIPTNNSFTSDTSQDINFTVSDTNINTCWYSNDSYTVNTTLTNCNTNITTVTWSEGQHNVTVYVNDSANNVNSSRVTFTIDTTFPTISYINPTPADKTFSTSNSL
ncbi:LamG domain-containing protein [Candidatus Pacearchaeota archaeon]|nr:LamG domain-containing protein [Candidatus Pacearchaeota archaeon]